MLIKDTIENYLGSPSENCCPDFLKILKYFRFQLDIFYPEHDFAIEVQGEQHEKYIEFFHRGDPNNFINNKHRINSRKNYMKRIRLP
jgi:hypothetical protein